MGVRLVRARPDARRAAQPRHRHRQVHHQRVQGGVGGYTIASFTIAMMADARSPLT
ncbi:MAG: hypothetical protein ACRD01_12080 [Terriglobales bacterium]